MMSARSTACSCGKQMYDSLERCSSCAQTRQKRLSQHKYVLPEGPTRQLTPPPNQPTSPRRSMEGPGGSTTPRSSYASEVLTNAFSAESSTSFFSQPFQRYAVPSTARTSSLPNSRRPSDVPSTSTTPDILSPASEQPSGKPTRSSTPDPQRSVAAYAPMAAGFARLNRKDQFTSVGAGLAPQGRTSSGRGSLELEARMFSGPA